MKVNELDGEVLDWAVAEAIDRDMDWELGDGLVRNGGAAPLIVTDVNGVIFELPFKPSSDWAQAGQIIEHDRLSYREERAGVFLGFKWNGVVHEQLSEGPTALVAAMRCFVASRLGPEIEVPEELTQARAAHNAPLSRP